MEWHTPRPVVVTDHGPWQEDKPEYGEFIELADPAKPDEKFRYSLGKDHDLDVPAVGTPVVVAIDTFIRQEARTSQRTGKAYIADLEKRRVVALKAA